MHARGTEEEYVQHAIAEGFDVLGFADHTCWPYKSDFVADMRMHISELDAYIAEIRRLEEKYASQIRIHCGLECEAFPEFYPWLRDVKAEKGLDYFILGNHYDTTDENGGAYFGKCISADRVIRYAKTTIAGMESGLFLYLAHPDLFFHRYSAFDSTAKSACRDICAAARDLDMILEYNLLGMKRNPDSRARGFIGYTSDEFWTIAAETGCRAIIGVDAHFPESLNCAAEYAAAREKLEGMGIEVVDSLEDQLA
jgi:histidinol-phosphatase (PHP family)